MLLASHNDLASQLAGLRNRDPFWWLLLFPPLSPPYKVESHSSLVPTADHDISVRGYLRHPFSEESASGIAAPPATGMTTSRWGVDCILSKLPLFRPNSPTPVQSLRAHHDKDSFSKEKRLPALGSNPADCPISCHYLPSQALVTLHLPFRKRRLATQEL